MRARACVFMNEAPPRRAAELTAEDVAGWRHATSNGAILGGGNLRNSRGRGRDRSRSDHGGAEYAGDASSDNFPDHASGADGRLSSRWRDLRVTEMPPEGKEQARVLGTM